MSLKIGIDFDDVIVHTMQEWVRLWNMGHKGEKVLRYEDITDWNVGRLLEVSETVIRNYFELVDYGKVTQVTDAVIGIKDLIDDGHEVQVLTKNPRYTDIRRWLDSHGLHGVYLEASLKDKANWAQHENFDVLIDDRPETLLDAARLGLEVVRMVRPWNMDMEEDVWEARTWAAVLMQVRNIERIKSDRSPDQKARDTYEMMTTKDVNVVRRYTDEEGVPWIEEKTMFHPDYVEPVITNAAGGKQSDIGARFDLLPARAIARVAEVLDKGEKKYGKDNWRLLSVDEITNHTIGHLINYLGRNQEEDLAHAACRALMALEKKIMELE